MLMKHFEIIKEISDKLKNGENFYDLALPIVMMLHQKDNGGDLEYFDADIFLLNLQRLLEGLGINEISEIVELEDTFHILKITEFNETRNIIIRRNEQDNY